MSIKVGGNPLHNREEKQRRIEAPRPQPERYEVSTGKEVPFSHPEKPSQKSTGKMSGGVFKKEAEEKTHSTQVHVPRKFRSDLVPLKE